jgi:alkylation response protein AidB-like acyl-CoA dehydrogenase
MQFRFDDEQLAMRDAVRTFCDDRFALAAVGAREGTPADETTWRGLAELGVLGMLAGDSGLGVVEAALVFEELGAHLTNGPILWSVLAAPYVPGVGDGTVRVTGHEPSPAEALGVVIAHADESDAVLVLHDDRLELVGRTGLPEPRASSPFDPLTPVSAYPSLPAGEVVARGDATTQMSRTGQVLAAALLVGAAQGALDVARSHALEREQFGVPIGSFQAVKHLLADMYVRVELARAATYAGAAIVADPRAGDPDHAAATAKLLSGDAGVANARAAVQVLGGMGFTWEMLPHYFLKRAFVLDQCFGTSSSHAAGIAQRLGTEVAAA